MVCPGASVGVGTADTSVGPSNAGLAGSPEVLGGGTDGTITGVGIEAGAGTADRVTGRAAASRVGLVRPPDVEAALLRVPIERFATGSSLEGSGLAMASGPGGLAGSTAARSVRMALTSAADLGGGASVRWIRLTARVTWSIRDARKARPTGSSGTRRRPWARLSGE
jgi:hypothetical protein